MSQDIASLSFHDIRRVGANYRPPAEERRTPSCRTRAARRWL